MEMVRSTFKKPDQQFDSRIDGKKTGSCGQKGASYYTKHKDQERNYAYINRSKK